MLRARHIVTLVLLSLGLSGCVRHKAPRGGDTSWREPQSMQAWTEKFTYNGLSMCDARVLGAFWHHSIPDAKARAGMKIERFGYQDLEKYHLMPAREQAYNEGRVRCSYQEAGFTDTDIQTLADGWSMSFPDAVAMVESKLIWGGAWILWDELKYAGEGNENDTGLDEKYMRAFFDSNLHYCDARLLAAAWGISVTEAKVSLGSKVYYNGDDASYFSELMAPARASAMQQGQPTCEWVETNYSYNDAEALGCFWGVSPEDAKLRIAQKVTAGEDSKVRYALTQAACR